MEFRKRRKRRGPVVKFDIRSIDKALSFSIGTSRHQLLAKGCGFDAVPGFSRPLMGRSDGAFRAENSTDI